MTDLVPREPVGQLFDDLAAIRGKPWNGTNFEDRFIEMGTVGGLVEVVKTGTADELGVGERIKRSLFGRRPFGEDHLDVPVSFILFRLQDLADKWGLHQQAHPPRDDDPNYGLVPIEELRELECFLNDINGPVRYDDWNVLEGLAAWGSSFEGGDRFRRTIREIRNELEAKELTRRRARQAIPEPDHFPGSFPGLSREYGLA
jgi:hypothetical protein